MEDIELFDETKQALENSNLSEIEKKVIINRTMKEVSRKFYSQYTDWKKIQEKHEIVGKYTDKEVINKLINKKICEKIESYNKSSEETSR